MHYWKKKTATQLNNAIFKLIRKKGDITRLNANLTSKPRFRSGFSTDDHLQVLKSVIGRTMEYSKPLALIFIEYEKAFDIINLYKMPEALADCRIGHRY